MKAGDLVKCVTGYPGIEGIVTEVLPKLGVVTFRTKADTMYSLPLDHVEVVVESR